MTKSFTTTKKNIGGWEHMDYRKKTVVASVAGLTLEGMDIMFISFAMSMIIAEFNIDLATGGVISSITNIGMLAEEFCLGFWQISLAS